MPRPARTFVVGLALTAALIGVQGLRAEDAPPAVPPAVPPAAPSVNLQRLTTAVPWPRGIVWRDGKLVVLARGVHRTSGGPRPDIEDRAGTLYEVDPGVFEPVVKGTPPGDAVMANARVLAEASSPPFRHWTRTVPAKLDTLTDRPYAGLIHDAVSENLIILAFSGIDLEEKPFFRKNATDGVYRYHIPSKSWHVIEAHNPDVVPAEELGLFTANDTFPHHDPAKNAPPHGLANGPCGACVAGNYLYVTAKDNSAIVQYDLTGLRKDPAAPPPPGRYVLRRSGPRDDPFIEVKGRGKMYVEGAGAAAVHGKHLYIAFRTTSQVMRMPIDANGDVVRPIVAEYLAQFDGYDYDAKSGEYSKSADFFDLRFNSKGECFISCNGQGTIWKVPTDGTTFLDARKGTTAKPFINMRKVTEHEKSDCGNFCFGPDDTLYVCTNNKDVKEGNIRGIIYRIPKK